MNFSFSNIKSDKSKNTYNEQPTATPGKRGKKKAKRTFKGYKISKS